MATFIPDWSQVYYVSQDDLGLLIPLQSPPECWLQVYTSTHSLFGAGAGEGHRVHSFMNAQQTCYTEPYSPVSNDSLLLGPQLTTHLRREHKTVHLHKKAIAFKPQVLEYKY